MKNLDTDFDDVLEELKAQEYECSDLSKVRSDEERRTGGAKQRPYTTTAQSLTTFCSSLRSSPSLILTLDSLRSSQNELAKVHARHLAGGRANAVDERLFRFEFPESPGALKKFLMALDVTLNVSLFHYRNHGDDFGRVLVGIQVPKTDKDEKCIKGFLNGLGYNWVEETNNEVYHDFLKSSRK